MMRYAVVIDVSSEFGLRVRDRAYRGKNKGNKLRRL